MKYLIIILEIILLCLTCTTSTANYINVIDEPQLQKTQRSPLNIEEKIIVEEISEPVEYENAHFIWNYLKDLGYTNVVVAGILGNIMVEVGGNTLDIQPTAETDEYYGVCQWKKKFFPEVVGVSIEEQCNFLRDNIEYEINTFSKKYSYKKFLEIINVREAALVFASGYERCNETTYSLRQDCAEIAYEYFMSEVVYEGT